MRHMQPSLTMDTGIHVFEDPKVALENLNRIEESPLSVKSMSTASLESSPSVVSLGSRPLSFSMEDHMPPIDIAQVKLSYKSAMQLLVTKFSKEEQSTELFEMATRLGRELQRSGRDEEALAYFRKALFMKNKTITEEPRRVQKMFAGILFDIGVIHERAKRHVDNLNQVKALQAFQMCLDFRLLVFGTDHPTVASAFFNLASVHATLGDLESAENLLLEALAILQFNCPQKSHLRHVWIALGKVQKSLGEVAESKSSLEEASSLGTDFLS
jgi:tetratricopeptide (TPR) repeat protein